MSLLAAALWFVAGLAAAGLAAQERVRRVRDLEFVRGWNAANRRHDQENPEVRRA
ncbi:MAG TPA: hypothetical protein VIG24_10600 [Acidimicrobiia bacterium]